MKSKTEKIKAYLKNTPGAKPVEVAAKFKVSAPYIYNLRKKVMAEFFSPPELLPVPEAPKSLPLESAQKLQTLHDVNQVLDTRAGQYGTFANGAALMQAIKRTMSEHAQKHGKTFADDQWEALEMIVHKMARIVNGNPDNVDSWTDIAGYAMLVADRLRGNAR
jgi:hypothetical protein